MKKQDAQKLDMKKYLAHYFALPREGSPNPSSTNAKECTERFSDHAAEGLLHLRRLKGI